MCREEAVTCGRYPSRIAAGHRAPPFWGVGADVSRSARGGLAHPLVDRDVPHDVTAIVLYDASHPAFGQEAPVDPLDGRATYFIGE